MARERTARGLQGPAMKGFGYIFAFREFQAKGGSLVAILSRGSSLEAEAC
jgi:hypothetical protein